MGSRKGRLVSIITPSYNQAQFIEETINSIKSQTYSNIEHIIVDGGSTDSTINILKSYENEYNMRWISESDSGMYGAINKGIDMAQGDILGYLNSDDLYFPWAVETVVAYFEKKYAPDMVFGDLMRWDTTAKKQSCELFFFPPFRLGHAIRTGVVAQPTAFWRRDVVKKIGNFNAELQFVGDSDYWVRVGKELKIDKVNEFLAVDRLHSASKRSTGAESMSKEAVVMKSKYLNQLKGVFRHLGFYDLVITYFWQRFCLLRFLVKFLSSDFVTVRGDWGNFISSDGFSMIDPVSVLTSFIPHRHLKIGFDFPIVSARQLTNEQK